MIRPGDTVICRVTGMIMKALSEIVQIDGNCSAIHTSNGLIYTEYLELFNATMEP